MNRRLKLFCLIAGCFLQISCGQRKPSVDDVKRAIGDYYAAQGQAVGDVTIVRFGESGKGDFSAPGSQDTYWPVEFDLPKRNLKEKVVDLGPLQISRETAGEKHGIAQVYRDKMGAWKVARVEH